MTIDLESTHCILPPKEKKVLKSEGILLSSSSPTERYPQRHEGGIQETVIFSIFEVQYFANSAKYCTMSILAV